VVACWKHHILCFWGKRRCQSIRESEILTPPPEVSSTLPLYAADNIDNIHSINPLINYCGCVGQPAMRSDLNAVMPAVVMERFPRPIRPIAPTGLFPPILLRKLCGKASLSYYATPTY